MRFKLKTGCKSLTAVLSIAAVTAAVSVPQTFADGNSGIVVTWKNNPQTIDPRNSYDGEDWNISRSLYQGLYSEDLHFNLKPLIAAGMPIISSGGKVYTVHIKTGVKWSNGKPVVAQDFVYALKTELSPAFKSPNEYLWYMLRGVSDYEAGKSKYLGIRALNATTIQYTLSKPYSAFPYVLTDPASYPIYPTDVKYIDKNPVTDGPYTIKSWKTGVNMVLTQNSYYKHAGPYPSQVTFDFNVNPSVGILRVQNQQADLVGDGIPSANYLQLSANPQTSSDITTGYTPAVVMLALNEKTAPFNNQLVREAVQMAINKKHLLQLMNDRGQVANTILPKSLPGFSGDKADPYTYNVAKAKQVLEKAGYPHGFTTELGLASEMTGSDQIEAEVQSDLKAIGITVNVKPLPQEATAMAQIPMMTYSWYMDYPDPADFINGFVTSPAVVGGSNPAFLSDSKLDALASNASAMPLGTSRVKAYEQVDERAMQDAAYVPLFYPELTYFHSSRMKGFDSPMLPIPAVYSNLSVSP